MKSKYSVRRPKSDDDDDDWYYGPDDLSALNTAHISVDERVPVDIDTGLLDQFGNKIIRTEYPNPIGYIWPSENE